MAKAINLNRRLRMGGVLVLLGLGVEAVSFLWNSPFAFFLFILGSGLLLVLGILIFLWSLVAGGEARTEPDVKGAAAAEGSTPARA